jgi:RimJ/RimL family protein N-acetyltransferase
MTALLRMDPLALPTLTLPLRTRRLLLRDFTTADLPAMRAYAGDAQVLEHVLYEARDAVQLRRHLDRVLASQSHRPRRAWELAIVVQRTGRVIGTCDLAVAGRREADLGYMLARRHWGHGYATEAASALVDHAFAQLAVERVCALVDVGNERSRRVLEKAGLHWEALLRRHAHAKGRWWDCHRYGLSRAEWQRACADGEALAS